MVRSQLSLGYPTASPGRADGRTGAGDSASAPAAGAWRRVRSGAGVPRCAQWRSSPAG